MFLFRKCERFGLRTGVEGITAIEGVVSAENRAVVKYVTVTAVYFFFRCVLVVVIGGAFRLA